MEILIKEKTDIPPQIAMYWMKRFKLSMRNLQLSENNQSEGEKEIKKMTEYFDNNETMKNTEIQVQRKPGFQALIRKPTLETLIRKHHIYGKMWP